MLLELESYFQNLKHTGDYMSIRLSIKDELISYTVCIHENKQFDIPAVMVTGIPNESLNHVCAIALSKILEYQENKKNDIIKPVMDKAIVETNVEPTFVDWNQYSLDVLADYLERKHMFSSSGEALAIYKLVEFYRKNKSK